MNSVAFSHLWILVVSTFVAGSWVLSYFQALNRPGYALLLGLEAILCWLWSRTRGFRPSDFSTAIRKELRRLRNPFALGFFIIVLFNFLGGALNDVNNGDALAYRIPRVMHWLSEGRWHWIHTGDERLNVIACNYELLAAPLLLFFHTDRLLFLLNIITYLLLPGLFFSFLKLVRVRPRVAAYWMWILPCSLIYAMQASAIATDAFSATPALAALVFGLRGVQRKSASDLCMSLIAFGFLAGIKQVNLPLGAVWIVPMIVGAPLLLKKPGLLLGATALAILISPLVVIAANIHYTGSWKGFKYNYEQSSAFWGLVGNILTVSVQNLQPPVFPWADQWNHAMKEFVTTPFGKRFEHFETFMAMARAPSEIYGGLGLAVTALLIATGLNFCKHPDPRSRPTPFYVRVVRWNSLIASAAFMAKSGLLQIARYMAPYYPFMLPLVLAHPANSALVRKRWWRRFAIATIVYSIAILAISRQRPIWPVELVTGKLTEMFPHSGFVSKVRNSFSFRLQVRTNFQDLKRLIPDSEKRVGYSARFSKRERPLWLGAKDRKVVCINPEDDAAYARATGVRYVVVEPSAIEELPEKTIDGWLKRFGGGQVVGTIETRLVPEGAPEVTYVVTLANPGTTLGPSSSANPPR